LRPLEEDCPPLVEVSGLGAGTYRIVCRSCLRTCIDSPSLPLSTLAEAAEVSSKSTTSAVRMPTTNDDDAVRSPSLFMNLPQQESLQGRGLSLSRIVLRRHK